MSESVEIHDGTVRGWPLYVTVAARVVADIPGTSVEDARPTAEFIADAYRAPRRDALAEEINTFLDYTMGRGRAGPDWAALLADLLIERGFIRGESPK